MDLYIFRSATSKFRDYWLLVAQLMYLVVIYTSIGLMTNPVKKLMAKRLGFDLEENRANVFLSCILLLTICFVASCCVDISNFINMTGGFMGTLFIFTFPGLMGMKLEYF